MFAEGLLQGGKNRDQFGVLRGYGAGTQITNAIFETTGAHRQELLQLGRGVHTEVPVANAIGDTRGLKYVFARGLQINAGSGAPR